MRTRRNGIEMHGRTIFLLIAFMLLAVWLYGAEPALRVLASPHSGLAPLQIRVDVRQDVERLSGREVCIQISGPEPALSCWTTDRPTPLMTRWFVLHQPGTYEVLARSGREVSNYVLVDVPAEELTR